MNRNRLTIMKNMFGPLLIAFSNALRVAFLTCGIFVEGGEIGIFTFFPSFKIIYFTDFSTVCFKNVW